MHKLNIPQLMQKILPIMIDSKGTSLTIGLSNRFILFELLNKITKRIEDDPYLNFISILKYYKVLNNLLQGTIYELHRDKNKAYFRDFFIDKKLHTKVANDLAHIYAQNKNLNVTITKRGIIIYDNYKKNQFNTFLLTTHSGSWMPQNIKAKQMLTDKKRKEDEDIGTDAIYRDLVLKNAGIWIDNKMSRFCCDYNRTRSNSIYDDHSETWFTQLWKKSLTKKERDWLMQGYDEFYFILSHLLDTHKFNMVFDGHSMRDTKNRPDFSFGTKYVPKFYMPIVQHMKKQLSKVADNCTVAYNKPYSGGHILRKLSEIFPNIFILSMEINKKIYMHDSKISVSKTKIIAKNLCDILAT